MNVGMPLLLSKQLDILNKYPIGNIGKTFLISREGIMSKLGQSHINNYAEYSGELIDDAKFLVMCGLLQCCCESSTFGPSGDV